MIEMEIPMEMEKYEEEDDDNDNSDYVGKDKKRQSKSAKGHRFWTEEKVEMATKMCMQNYKTKDIANLIDMSYASVCKFKDAIYPEEVDGQWKKFIIKKRGAKKKDRTELKNAIIDILRDDNTLSLKEISERLPEHLKVKRSAISEVLKEMNWSKKKGKFVCDKRNKTQK